MRMRIPLSFAVTALALTAFAACGTKDKDNGDSSPAPSAQATPKKAASDEAKTAAPKSVAKTDEKTTVTGAETGSAAATVAMIIVRVPEDNEDGSTDGVETRGLSRIESVTDGSQAAALFDQGTAVNVKADPNQSKGGKGKPVPVQPVPVNPGKGGPGQGPGPGQFDGGYHGGYDDGYGQCGCQNYFWSTPWYPGKWLGRGTWWGVNPYIAYGNGYQYQYNNGYNYGGYNYYLFNP